MSRDVECMIGFHGWTIVVEAIDLHAMILNETERPELTPRWWRDESDRYRVRSSPPMMVKVYECGHVVKTDVPATHEINRMAPLRPLGKCEACRSGVAAWGVELLQGTPALLEMQRTIDQHAKRWSDWSTPSDPIADIKAGIKAALASGRSPPPRWEPNPLRNRIVTPICALCREPVYEWSTMHDAIKRQTVYSAWCHGREDVVIITDDQLVSAARGTLYVWGQLIL